MSHYEFVEPRNRVLPEEEQKWPRLIPMHMS